jgi:hypothetical protein
LSPKLLAFPFSTLFILSSFILHLAIMQLQAFNCLQMCLKRWKNEIATYHAILFYIWAPS